MNLDRRNALIAHSPDVRILPFGELPVPAQLALVWYMAVEGSAWAEIKMPDLYDMTPEQEKAALLEHLPLFAKHFYSEPVGLGMIGTAALQNAIMQDPELCEGHESFDAYHQRYLSAGDVERHPQEGRWPVILSNDPAETLIDGWHRLHDYIRSGATEIPFVYFPEIMETMSAEKYEKFRDGVAEDLLKLYEENRVTTC